jgi:hypothetical protein
MVLLRFALLGLFASHAHGSWVDPDTPEEYTTIEPMSPGDERQYELVRLFACILHCFIDAACLLTLVFSESYFRYFLMNLSKMVEPFTMEMIPDGQL